MTTAAVVTTPAVDLIPHDTASSMPFPGVERLADPAQDEDVVVHRESEEDDEEQQGHDRVDAGRRAHAGQALPTPCWNTSTNKGRRVSAAPPSSRDLRPEV